MAASRVVGYDLRFWHYFGECRCVYASFFMWKFAVQLISIPKGLNALIKSNQQQSKLRAKVPSPTILDINIKGTCLYVTAPQYTHLKPLTLGALDVENSGIVLTTVAALIASLTFLMILYHLFMSKTSRSPRASLLQSAVLGFCTVWLFAAQVPFTLFFATRSAKVRAFVGKVELPAQVIHSVEKALGATSVYKDIPYRECPSFKAVLSFDAYMRLRAL